MALVNIPNNKHDKVVMYTSETCADYQIAKRFFSENNIEVEYKNIAERQNRNELLSKYGFVAVPTIVIENKVIFWGSDKIKMKLFNYENRR